MTKKDILYCCGGGGNPRPVERPKPYTVTGTVITKPKKPN